MSVTTYAKKYGRIARKENKQIEKIVKLNTVFRSVKGVLITIIGRC